MVRHAKLKQKFLQVVLGYSGKPNKLRFGIDPKDLNRAIKRSLYPMPPIEEVATKLSKAKVLTVLDTKSGFW